MNIEAYDAEALRKIVRLLEYENRLLKDKLKKENIPYDEINPFEETIEMQKSMISTKERVLSILRLLQKRWRYASFLCFGEERMSTPGVVRMAAIFHNVIIDGI